MKVRVYPKDYTKRLREMTTRGIDEDGNGFYIIDISDITNHKPGDTKQPSILIKSKNIKKKQSK